ncbi:hypothetical protein L3Q82_017044 [Scortum barcoo]|uniref:Uncharacterized protein n=1 Tax=Scortum barcoo TaxID=214431 RepID=A0ACB8X8I9_9TELE|nr:hypothetical protein L3Q82_017044 [Scortum barcoo]
MALRQQLQHLCARMESQEVGALLEECLQAAAAAPQSTKLTEAERLNYCSCTGQFISLPHALCWFMIFHFFPVDLLCAELASLLQEAMGMKWPFVPEKWQYKQSVSVTDKTNLSDLISKHLSQLLAVLKVSIVAQEPNTALAVVFLVDRFLYWADESNQLLRITKLLHRRYPDAPVAPQLVIRQARVYLNSGKLQKAEYILSSLINNSGATGCWVYHSESDRALVRAVSVQVRGMILQKLGLWLEAAELIWASLVGYYALPQPDKKGIGTSLGILANILVSMNDEDFRAFRTNPDIDLATQGTCLLSYSFSVECPALERQSFLLQAREAFAIGLLTKAEDELVTSKQELHTFLKAAYSLTVTHKWLGAPQEVVAQATQACQRALANFYDYCHADTQDKDTICAEIMHLVAQVKRLLRVEPFLNSDKGSFVPDSYREIKDASVNFTLEGFAKVMQRFQKYHASLCETTNTNCKGTKDEVDGARLCITALGTTIGTLNTECTTEACKVSKDTPKAKEPQQRGSNSCAVYPPQKSDLCTTVGSTDNLGSSWQNFSLSGSGSPRPSNSSYKGSIAVACGTNVSRQSCITTEADEYPSNHMLQFTDKNKKRNSQGCTSGFTSHTVPRSKIPSTSSSVSSGSDKFELIQAEIETQDTEEDWMTDVAGVEKSSVTEGAAQSLSQLTFRTSSSSLSDSFSSQSSWEKISADLNSPADNKSQSSILSKAGTSQRSKSPKSDGSFFLMETLDCETHDSVHKPTYVNHTSGRECRASSEPRPLESFNADPNMDTKIDSVSVKDATKNSLATPRPNLSPLVPEQCASTEASTESSFEMLEENQSGHQPSEVIATEKANVPQRENPLCYCCLKHRTVDGAVPERQYLLSQLDYQALLAGVCHECLLKRLHSDKKQFKLKEHRAAYSALHLKFSKATGLWTARETCVYIGEPMGAQGKQRTAIWVQFLHQEERLSSYVGKDYLKPKEIQFHLKDVERQMTAQYYVTEFNKSLYDKEVMAQIFFIPSEALLILNGLEIVGCVTVEPYMLGDFVKLTNNTWKKEKRFKATEYGLAFGHFTYLFSDCQEVVVDLQGWVTANGKGLIYLTDPQIHSTKTPKGPSNFADRGLRRHKLTHAISLQSTQNEKLWVYAKYLYDGLGQRTRLMELGTYENKTFSFDALLLFREATMYEINRHNRTCKKMPLKADFHPLAIPKDASLLGQAVVGSSSAPRQGLLVNSWVGEVPDNGGKYVSTVTEFGCIPISTMYHTDQFGWMITSFFNNIIGISDPGLLNPPDYCVEAEMEADADSMRGFILFLCLSVGCLAQRPQQCSDYIKKTLSYILLLFSKFTQNAKLTAYAKYSYDALEERIRLREFGSYKNKTFHLDVLLLYKQGVMYKINYRNQTCCKKKLSMDFHPLAIPKSASLLGQAVLGSSSGPRQGLLVNTWTGELQMKKGKAKYMSTVTEYGCIPVSNVFHTERKGWMVTNFFNNVIGLVDPRRFIPPSFCQDAQLEAEDGEDQVTFFSLF